MLLEQTRAKLVVFLVDLIARVESGGGGGGVEKGLREEQILMFQALPFILFPHAFHKDKKLRQSQELRHKQETSDDARHLHEP
jgi:hypothetical protein